MRNTDTDALVPVAWAQLGLRNGHTYVRMFYEGHIYPPGFDVVRNLNLAPLYGPDTIERLTRERDEAVAAIREFLEFQSAAEGPTIHEWARWRRVADASRTTKAPT